MRQKYFFYVFVPDNLSPFVLKFTLLKFTTRGQRHTSTPNISTEFGF